MSVNFEYSSSLGTWGLASFISAIKYTSDIHKVKILQTSVILTITELAFTILGYIPFFSVVTGFARIGFGVAMIFHGQKNNPPIASLIGIAQITRACFEITGLVHINRVLDIVGTSINLTQLLIKQHVVGAY